MTDNGCETSLKLLFHIETIINILLTRIQKLHKFYKISKEGLQICGFHWIPSHHLFPKMS